MSPRNRHNLYSVNHVSSVSGLGTKNRHNYISILDHHRVLFWTSQSCECDSSRTSSAESMRMILFVMQLKPELHSDSKKQPHLVHTPNPEFFTKEEARHWSSSLLKGTLQLPLNKE